MIGIKPHSQQAPGDVADAKKDDKTDSKKELKNKKDDKREPQGKAS